MTRRRNFNQKTVLITGAAGGIGTALARRFGAAGARLGLVDRDNDRTDGFGKRTSDKSCRLSWYRSGYHRRSKLPQRRKRHSRPLPGHRRPDQQRRADPTQRLYQYYGRCLPLVMAVNFFGSLYCTQAAADDLIQRQGMIIVMSSVAGFSPLYGRSGYCGR